MIKHLHLVILSALICLTPAWGNASSETDTAYYSVFMGSRDAGLQKAWVSENGNQVYFFTFNDRGRGPALTEEIAVGNDGLLKSISVTGHDYTKNQVDEQFAVENGMATWKSASDEGSGRYTAQYYYPVNGTIGGKEVLIQFMENTEVEELDLFPFGKIKLSIKETFDIEGQPLTLFGLSGVSYAPSFYWMDESLQLFAVVSPSRGITCIRKGQEGLKDILVKHQVEKEDEFYKKLAEELTHSPSGKTAIWNVDVFNSITGKVDRNRVVAFEGDKIVLNDPVSHHGKAAFDEIIEGEGRTLLPGFFDMHVHVSKVQGILHIAGGVTSVRDMAVQVNMIESKQKLAANFNSGEMIGPRIVGMCGFIDGSGPFTRDMGIDNVELGLEWVDQFHEAGIGQIKLYSSIKPEWVKPLAKRAHKYDMVVSGHIPAFMTATQAIADGFDEIQHTNMLFLNFYGNKLDTRNMTRFSAVGEQGYAFDFDSKQFKDFVKLLKKKNIVIDPTLAIFEWGFKSVSGVASPTYAKIVDRLPLSNRRQYYTGGFARPPGMHQKYLDSYDRMVDMVYELHSRGVRIVPGTDNLPGFAYHRELELYVESGIPSSEVLQLATIRAAEVAGLDATLGSIEVGKVADMVLVNGDVLSKIENVRQTVLVVKNGDVFRSDRLYPQIGVSYHE